MSSTDTPWWAVRYEAMAAVHPAFAGEVDLFAEAQIDAVLALLQPAPGARVVDVGCGAGRHSVLLAERGFEVTGVDLSPQLLRRATHAWQERRSNRPGPRFVPGDMRWLPVDGPFDVALFMDMALGVFDEDEEHLQTLRSCRRVLRPGGQVLIELFNPFHWAQEAGTRHFAPGTLLSDTDLVRRYTYEVLTGRVEDRVVLMGPQGRRELPVQSLRAWTPPEIRALLRRAGFRGVRVHGSDGWEPPEPDATVQLRGSPLMWVSAKVP